MLAVVRLLEADELVPVWTVQYLDDAVQGFMLADAALGNDRIAIPKCLTEHTPRFHRQAHPRS